MTTSRPTRPRPEKIDPAAKIQHRAPNPVTSAQSPFRAGLERREGSARVDCPCPAPSSPKFQKTSTEVLSTCFSKNQSPEHTPNAPFRGGRRSSICRLQLYSSATAAQRPLRHTS
ncbi:uncharacterized protein SCHCODRAFT_02118700 [Schizophyllum commune H4-8]|uniref:uncharacterized protein n=1 Tax=Schizophyllum commune (strain H4-8 / FGSC 9210) TaxID=578458 RepID=UPI0021607A3D|nr:uncharacterized protein SCHCODRAFT_02118700 [Schizophyllum commune H4-8]KAI5885565.1 hypothetical protein SCHCODRAFT_02118700 [Schizophyllum commune H4-8]